MPYTDAQRAADKKYRSKPEVKEKYAVWRIEYRKLNKEKENVYAKKWYHTHKETFTSRQQPLECLQNISIP